MFSRSKTHGIDTIGSHLLDQSWVWTLSRFFATLSNLDYVGVNIGTKFGLELAVRVGVVRREVVWVEITWFGVWNLRRSSKRNRLKKEAKGIEVSSEGKR